MAGKRMAINTPLPACLMTPGKDRERGKMDLEKQRIFNALFAFDLQVASLKSQEICRMINSGKGVEYSKALVTSIVDEQFRDIETALREQIQ